MSEEIVELPMNDEEEGAYQACLSLIKAGLAVYYEVGNCLLQVFERRLYRSRYASFEAFLKAECDIERAAISYSYARRLMEATKMTNAVIDYNKSVPIGTLLPLPANESQTRPLRNLEPDVQVNLWECAVEEAEGETPPARVVKAVVEAYKAETTPPPARPAASPPSPSAPPKAKKYGYTERGSGSWDGKRKCLWYIHLVPRNGKEPLRLMRKLAGEEIYSNLPALCETYGLTEPIPLEDVATAEIPVEIPLVQNSLEIL